MRAHTDEPGHCEWDECREVATGRGCEEPRGSQLVIVEARLEEGNWLWEELWEVGSRQRELQGQRP